MSMTQKERQKQILGMVYKTAHFERIEENERPDFLLKYRAIPERFGVEVTEFYYTESDARLKNISGYRNEFIEDKEYRHKDDKDILQVGEIKILDPDDNSVKAVTDAIIREDAHCK